MTTHDTDTARLAKAMEDANKLQRSPLRPIWQGALFGIGSTVGLALALYLLSLILRPFVNLPFFGDLIKIVEPTLKQSQRFSDPAVDLPIAPVVSEPAATPTASKETTGHSTIRNNYFALELPGSWSMKIRQHSNEAALLAIAAESDQGSVFAAQVTTTKPLTSYPDTATPKRWTIDGVAATGMAYQSDATTRTVDALVEHDGRYYSFSLTYPATSDDDSVFQTIVSTITFI